MNELWRLTHDELANFAVSQCAECGGTGQYRDDYTRNGDAWRCTCRDDFRRRCDDAELPARFAERALGDLEWERIAPDGAREAVQEYADHLAAYLGEALGLILSGGVGCGKTHLAIGVAKLACAFGYTVLFVNAPAWLQELRDAYAANEATVERERLEEMRRADVLILDDLGAEKPSDWARERLYLVVNQRAVTRRATIATTNRALEELEHAVGERTMSRLYGDALALTLAGGDYRRVEREARLRRVRENPAPLPTRGGTGAARADDCPICRGAGFVRRDLPLEHPDFGRAALCACQRRG